MLTDGDRPWLTRRFGDGGAVFLCRAGDEHAVLKLTPDLEVAAREARALTAWAGTPAMVGLIDADLPSGALLLDAINPGTPAPDPARVLPELHTAAPDGFPPLIAHVNFMFEVVITNLTGTHHLAEHERARALARHDVGRVLLHGDLHAGNVLQGPRGPVAIDPQACVGDPAFDFMDLVHDLHGADVDLDRVHDWIAAFKPLYDFYG